MRVLHVGSGFRPLRVGGLVAYIEELMHEQVRRGEDVAYFFSGRYYPYLGRPRLKRWSRGGVAMLEVVNSPLYDHGRQPVLELDEPQTERLFERAIQHVNPDVVHFHELAGLPSSLLDLVRRAGTPSATTLADYFPLCSTFKLLDAQGKVCLRRDVGADCVASIAADPRPPGLLYEATVRHELNTRRVLRHLPYRLTRRLARSAGTRVKSPPAASPQAFQHRREVNVERLNRADRLIAMSERVAEIYSLLGVDRSRMSTIHLTLPRIERLRPRRQNGKRPNGKRPVAFATVAGLSSHAKGSHLLVDAARLLSDSVPAGSFRLIALGPVDPAVAAEVEQLEEIEVGAPGPFTDDQLDAALDEVDVGIVPSIWEEAYGFVGPEFLAKGVPVIANAIGGMPEYTREGETGWLNRSCSAPELARIMRDVIEHPEQVTELNAKILATRETLIKPMDRHGDEIDTVYRETISGRALATRAR
jgi:glycosyltransferase involved in cell wall biosynthesis